MSVELIKLGNLALLRLNRPESLNALSFAILHEISSALTEVSSWPVRGLVITGAGEKAFCAGADIKELRGRPLIEQKRGAEFGQRTFAQVARLPFPSIAAITGFAFGGGLELALACTFRLATPNAKLGLPEIKLGLVPGYGGTQRLARLIGEARALEMILLGRAVSADEAERFGLVNRVVKGDAVEAATRFAAEFTSYSMLALQFSRETVTRALDVPIDEGLKLEADLSTLAYRTADAEEGVAAFLEKRKPEFRDE